MAKRRVYVLSNLATSLDGKIATRERAFFPLGSGADLKEMLRLRKSAQAVIVGASTLRPYRKASLSGRGGKQPINAVVSSSLAGLSASWPFFKDPRVHRILFTTRRAPEARRKQFAKTCEVVIMGGRVSARQILAKLAQSGVRRAIVEGGGTLMWDFAKDNLIDEYHVTLTPRILGGKDAPTLVDGEGLAAARSLKLKLRSARRKGDELYLVYAKTPRRGA
jgi:2,5-diamino-6-(ribosylamino)-4(3H)-pyrimidinone 5'-phosphate reductase